jgi:hypothetical protein
MLAYDLISRLILGLSEVLMTQGIAASPTRPASTDLQAISNHAYLVDAAVRSAISTINRPRIDLCG